jgi:BASS family bile acid:Na+ symporter
MDTLHLVLNAVTVIFIAATMFAAGLRATVPALRGVFADVPLLSLALIANMVVPPCWAGASARCSVSPRPPSSPSS